MRRTQFTGALDGLKGKTIVADPATAAAAMLDRLHRAGATIKHQPDPCQLPKACKNPLEIEGMRKAHIRDGAAMVGSWPGSAMRLPAAS